MKSDIPSPLSINVQAKRACYLVHVIVIILQDVVSKLEEIEGHGKYDPKNCTAVLDLWDLFSRISPERLPNYPLVFKRTVK